MGVMGSSATSRGGDLWKKGRADLSTLRAERKYAQLRFVYQTSCLRGFRVAGIV
jgi:hypothetical protein